MYYDNSGSQITKEILLQALNHLGELLQQKNQRLELVCCGGVVSVLYHHSRQMTHDVDVLFPNNPHVVEMLGGLIDQVGVKFNLEHGPKSKWFNDSVNFIGLETKSEVVVFRHPYLILKAADWHEMLAHKLTAYRGKRDITDAIHFLKEIKNNDKQQVFLKTSKYRPFMIRITDAVFEKRFNDIWEAAHGK